MKKGWFFGVIILILVIGLIAFIVNVKKNRLLPAIKQIKSAGSIANLIHQVKALEAENELQAAKDIYQKLINEFPNSAEIMNWQKKVEEINIKLLFSPVITVSSIVYEIKLGDTLIKIAKEFNTTPELIARSNNLVADKILPGRKIKIWTAPFSILVDKSQNTLLLKSREEVIKAYIVSTGANNSTPVGNFRISDKLQNPTWFKAGAIVPPDNPENILGSRWMGIGLVGYGIHGTTDPQSLGKQVTQGCVRMSNPDVEELYTIIPVGTEVIIVE